MDDQFYITMVAGEASGDQLAADLILALRKKYPNLIIDGIAGPKMEAVGCKVLFPMERLAVMGYVEPLKRLPELLKIRRAIRQHVLKTKPNVFVGIDAPDFNLGLEEALRKSGIRTVHYVSPSVWAWRRWRIRKIKRAVDLMLTLLPFETNIYESNNIPVQFVGHPLADRISLEPDQKVAREKLKLNLSGLTRKDEMRDENERETGFKMKTVVPGVLPTRETEEVDDVEKKFLNARKDCTPGTTQNLNEDFERVFNKADRFSRKSPGLDQQILAILPGSRAMELKYLARLFIETAEACEKKIPNLKIITSMVSAERRKQFEKILKETAPNLSVKIFDKQSHEVMLASDVVLLASGTATLEAMLLKRPMVVAYRMHPINYWIAKTLVKLEHISLPNLIAGKTLVPEFIQRDATVSNLAHAVVENFEDKARVKNLQAEFLKMHQQLKQNASEKAAATI